MDTVVNSERGGSGKRTTEPEGFRIHRALIRAVAAREPCDVSSVKQRAFEPSDVNSAPPTPATPTTSDSAPPSPGSPSGSHGGASPEHGTSHSHGYPLWDSDRFTLSEEWLVDDSSNPASPESVTGPPRTPPPSSPEPSKGSPPSKDGHPAPSPGPDVNPPPSSELQRPAEHEAESFLEKLLKGKIRRHISGPVAVYAAERELQATIDPTTYVAASLPLLPTPN
jgi:hypothetical protein